MMKYEQDIRETLSRTIMLTLEVIIIQHILVTQETV